MHPHTHATAELVVFADYNSFEIRDPDADHDLDVVDDMVDDLLRDFVSSSPGVVAVGTFRRAKIPVTVRIQSDPPTDEPAERWDHIAEAGLHLTGDEVLIIGGEDPRKAARLPLAPGNYRVRIHYGGLDTVTDGRNGNDHYHVTIWPDSVNEPVVIKRYAGQRPGA